jgi:hypothetical protein
VGSCFQVVVTEANDGLLRFPIDLQNKNPKDPTFQALALFDSGANCNIINKKFSECLELDLASIKPAKRIKFANKSKSELCSTILLYFEIEHDNQRCRFGAEFLICELAEEVIFGRGLLDDTGLMHLIITNHTFPNPFELSANSVSIVHLDDKDGEEGDDDITDSQSLPPAFSGDTADIWLGFAEQYGLDVEGLFNVTAWAALNSDFKIGEILNRIEDIKILMKDPLAVAFERSDLHVERPPHKNAPYPEVNKAVHSIMNAFNVVWDKRRLGLAKFRGLKINFNRQLFRPRKIKSQNLNPVMQGVLSKELSVFTDAGLMSEVSKDEIESGNIVLSPMDLIPKPTPGKYRVITDFNRSGVNDASEVLNYPAPNVEEHLDFVSGKDLISIADAMSFFWQLPLHIESRNICCTLSVLGILRYNCVPQGLNNSAVHCSQVVHESLVVESLTEMWKAYLDDFGTGANFRQVEKERYWDFLIHILLFHLWALRYNVRFSPEHAFFGFTAVEFLGHKCSKAGKEISESRTVALRTLVCEHSKQGVGHFLGCFVFIAKFIPHFAELAAPLYNLLKKGIRIDQAWSSDCDTAVSNLKHCIDIAPILRVVDWLIPLIMRTDGSGIAVGGCLFQIIDLLEKVVAYGSKKLSKSQLQWAAVQIECYSIITFIRKWKSMMQGHPCIVLEIDAQNLIWARSSTNDMIRRWMFEIDNLLKIARIKHIRGVTNDPPDSLSRCFSLEIWDDRNLASHIPSDSFEVCNSTVVCCGSQDEVCDSDDEPVHLLGRYQSDIDVVMSAEICDIIALAHNDEIGHAGVSGTMLVLRQAKLHKSACFKSIGHCTKCVSAYIRGCPTCQLTYMLLESKYPLHEMVTHEYFNCIDIDFCYIGLDRCGYKDILGIRCRFTRYVEAFPCKTSTIEEFAPKLLSVGGRYGFMQEVCMDGASYFSSGIIDELLELMGTKRKRISAYRPQSNPMERSNKEVLRHLRVLCCCRPEVQDEWSTYLPIVVSVINGTFNATTHTTPSKMMYGDAANRLRGILLPFGPKVRAELGPNFASRTSEIHAFIMAAAEEFHQERIRKALQKMPAYNREKVYRQGEYVVAVLPENSRKPKLQPQYRGIYLVTKTSGNNDSTVHCRCPVSDEVVTIQAQDLRLLDLRTLASSEEAAGWSAKLLNVPEYVVVDISNHRFTATRVTSDFSDTDLPGMEFLCHYKMQPPHDQHWNEYEAVKNLKLLDLYINKIRNRIPLLALNGKEFEDCNVVSLKHFCKTYSIDISNVNIKAEIVAKIRAAILERD